MLNVMTVDVEDYFHVEAFASHIPYEEWDSYKSRVEQNVARILELFARHETRGTFFMLGWVAEKFPSLTREIAAAGHEIGCHGYAHRRLLEMTPKQFRADLSKATMLLADQIQQPIRCFRAPSFSIVEATMWAFEILADEGYCFDSSVFPVHHDLYGVPDAERFPHWHGPRQSAKVFEFPPSTLRWWDNNCGIAGGGYLRLIPYGVTHWALRHINEADGQPAMVYFHPWEIDPAQPRIRTGVRSTLRHYTNLFTMEEKIERLLQDFRFTTLSDACGQHPAYRQGSLPSCKEIADAASAVPARMAAGAGR